MTGDSVLGLTLSELWSEDGGYWPVSLDLRIQVTLDPSEALMNPAAIAVAGREGCWTRCSGQQIGC